MAKDPGYTSIHHKEQLKEKPAAFFYNVNLQYEPKILQANSPTNLIVSITERSSGNTIKEFETIHDKLMHLIIVSRDLSYFAHIHPTFENSNNTFAIYHNFPEAGEYKVWIDFKPKEGSQTLITFELKVAGSPIHNLIPLIEDRQYLKNVEGQYQIGLTAPNEIRIDEDIDLRFNIFDASGNPITDLEPLMGAGGHCIIISNNIQDYLHVHPIQEVQSDWRGGPEVSFKTRFSNGGLYKVWGQFSHNGRVITVDFILKAV
ncbi:MAG: hypothetical protein L0H53_12220 [Candidatus Nitrosocosmicus sp.]|nr:hypothetical protein [Candidatus Nitrosocosmicus sp.]